MDPPWTWKWTRCKGTHVEREAGLRAREEPHCLLEHASLAFSSSGAGFGKGLLIIYAVPLLIAKWEMLLHYPVFSPLWYTRVLVRVGNIELCQTLGCSQPLLRGICDPETLVLELDTNRGRNFRLFGEGMI